MRIGELGRRVGVTAKTIRYYEGLGLLPEPRRTEQGYRDYGTEATERLRFIRDAQATGLSLDEIASILDMRDHGERTCGHVVELLEHHLAEIDRQIFHLRATRRTLAEMTDRARALDPRDCADPHRCQTIGTDLAKGTVERSTARRLHGAPHRHP